MEKHSFKRIKGRWIMTLLIGVTLSFPTNSTPLYSNIQTSQEIDPRGGTIMAEDPGSGITVGLNFPEGALNEKTLITLIIHDSPQQKVLGKTHINGISVLPKGLLLQEKVQLSVYNPPSDVTETMLLYRMAGEQFIIPLGDQQKHIDENWIEGTFFITGTFSLGTPTATEMSVQCKKLAAYNPARPMAYAGEDRDTPLNLVPDFEDQYSFKGSGPFSSLPPEFYSVSVSSPSDDEECMRWQKALTQVEAHMTWVEQYIYMNNPTAEQAERRAAKEDLQEAIDGYLGKASPANRCGSYIRAAAKYLEASTLLGMNVGDESPIAQQFSQLADECSFVFTVETREWFGHPKEMDLGGMFEEKSDWYGEIKCYIPWNEFIATGNQQVKGTGTMSLHYENHWVGDEKESHIVTNGTWKSDKIEGAVTVTDNEYGQMDATANITIYWTKTVTTHIWGKDPHDSYDETGSDTKSYDEFKSYNLKHGYEEKTGDAGSGISIRVMILKQPGNGRDDPDDCF